MVSVVPCGASAAWGELESASVGVEVHYSSAGGVELSPDLEAGQNRTLPVCRGAGARLGGSGDRLNGVEQLLVKALNLGEEVVLAGVPEGEGSDALFDQHCAAAVFVLVRPGVTAALPIQRCPGDGDHPSSTV